MILTKKTTQTWASTEDQYRPDLKAAYHEYCLNAKLAGITDGVYYPIVPAQGYRLWLDETAATEWKAWLENAAQQYGSTLLSCVIEDYQP